MSIIKRFLADTSGATSIEYALVAAGIAVVIVGVVSTTGRNANRKFQSVSNTLT